MNSVIKGASYVLAHTPQMVVYNGTTQTTERVVNPESEYLKELSNKGVDIVRTELYLARQELKLSSYFKERTPADCKFLQNALKTEYQFEDIPPNMMPMAQLEAIVGALIMRERANNPENIEKIFEFGNLDVINIKNKIVTIS